MKFFTFHFNWQSLFHLVWFHWIQKFLHSRLLLRALRPFSTLQNIVTKFTKCFKGCYCPLRHIKNLVETITKALTRKIFNLLTFNFFFMHTTQSILYILYSTHYYVIILKHGSLNKFWASETHIPQENQIKLNLIILVNQTFYRGIHMFSTILANERMGSLWMQHGSQVLEIGFTLQV